MASIASLSEYPQRVKDLFLTPTYNEAGIYAVRFYIRGKPWVVEVDDQMLFKSNQPEKEDEDHELSLKFA